MKKIFMILLISISIFVITGCKKENTSTGVSIKDIIKNEKNTYTGLIEGYEEEGISTSAKIINNETLTVTVQNINLKIEFYIKLVYGEDNTDLNNIQGNCFSYLDKIIVTSENDKYKNLIKDYVEEKFPNRPITEEEDGIIYTVDISNEYDENMAEYVKNQEKLKNASNEEINEMLKEGTLITY